MTALIEMSRDLRDAIEYIKDLPAYDEAGQPIDYGDALTDTLDGLAGEFQDKLVACAAFKKDCESDAAAIRAQIALMQKRAQALEAKAERIAGYMLYCMKVADTQKIKTTVFSIAYRPTQSCSITDETALPAEFLKVKTEPKKREILAALKAGTAVPGAEILTKDTLYIR